MTASKLNREWDPFTLAEGIANSDLKDKAEKVIAQYNRRIKVFHPDLVLTGKVATASAARTILKTCLRCFDAIFRRAEAGPGRAEAWAPGQGRQRPKMVAS